MHRHLPTALAAVVFACASFGSFAQGIPDPGAAQIAGVQLEASQGIQESTSDIQSRPGASAPAGPRPDHEFEYPDRSNLPQNPGAAPVSRFPAARSGASSASASLNIHTTSLSFNGPTLSDTSAFPPDSMGTAGPTQFIAFVNGRLRSYNKISGVADGVINANPDVFFASVMTPVVSPVVLNFTSDPQIRYDRFTGRWFVSIIDVPCTINTCATLGANRWLLAVSNAASNGTISGSTVWTFFQFKTDLANFCDYPSLGIDVNALYVGCNMFTPAGAFAGTNGYVIQKASTLAAGPLVVTSFANLALAAGAGPEAPRGVDNFDSTATEGYFVGPDNASFGTIMFRRVSNPGSLTPTISANIAVAVSTTTFPNPVEHAGNTGGTNGRLDSIDDRFFQAMIRNGHLWTAHHFRVSSAGVANTAAEARNAVRWYEFQNLTGTPSVFQSGTVFDSASTRVASFQYWYPSIAVTGQGHAIVGFSLAGTPSGATPAYVGRLSGDTLGTMVAPPTTGAVSFGTTAASYNPPSDPGGSGGRRWGDYSFTVVDPLDDMSVWTIQEYNQAANSYAVRIARLLAPPPAAPTCGISPIAFSGPTGDIVINATSSNGSGFYDPGANLPAPARPFNHLTASITNAVVNSATYNTPTQVTLNITASVVGLQDLTITNPDGQTAMALDCIDVSAPSPATAVSFTTQPASASNIAAGATIPIVAHVVNSVGNPVAGQSITLAIGTNAGSSTLSVTTNPVVTNASGDATFSAVSLNKVGSGYTLTATDTTTPAATAATSHSFNIVAGAATSITFTTQPASASNVVAGANIPLTVHVQDANANPISADNVTLGFSNNAGSSTLSVTANPVATNASGNAVFAGVSLNKVGANYALKATDSSGAPLNVIGNNFNIVAGAATSITFTTQPANASNIVAGVNIPLTVHVQDTNANPISADNVTLGFSNNAGSSTLSVTANPVATNASGDAVFAGVSLDKIGTNYSFKAADSSGVPLNVVGNNFNIIAGAATSITFTTQPASASNIVAGANIPLTVHVQDTNANPIASDSVTLGFSNNAGTSTLSVTANPVATNASGDAVFAGVSLNKSGTNYSLKATDSSGTPLNVVGNNFNIIAGAATSLTFTTQPANASNVVAGANIALTAHVQDTNANPIASDNVTLAFSNNAGSSTLSVTANPVATNASGDAVFAGVSLNKSGANYSLKATDSSGTPLNAVGNNFNIIAGAATSITFTTQPANASNVVAGANIPLTVHVQDTNANPIASDNVTLAFGNNAGSSTLSVTANPVATNASGNAVFAGVSLNKTGTNYSFKATDSSAAPVNVSGNDFDIVAGAAASITFTAQPSDAAAGVAIAPAIVAHVQDALANPVAGESVSLAIVNNAGGTGLLTGGGAQLSDALGDSTFSAVSIDKTGVGYTVSADDGVLTTTSAAFTISPGAAAQLEFVTQPGNLLAGTTTTAAVRVEDAFGNVETSDDTTEVTLSVNACGTTILGVATVSSGLAQFPSLRFYTVTDPGTRQLHADTDTALAADSNTFVVQANSDKVFWSGLEACVP